jgi:Nuclease-related domain
LLFFQTQTVGQQRDEELCGERRAPGQHARSKVLRLRMRTLLALGVLAVVTGALGRAFGLRSGWFVGSELALLTVMFLVSRYVLPLVDRHDRGASGEERVGALLDGLAAQGWHAIHDVRFDHGNVDHIALGPGGLFTIETKSHPGPIHLRRIHGATLRQAQGHARALEAIVEQRVEPLIVYSRAWVDKPLGRRRGVRVLPAGMLPNYLERRSATLTMEQLEGARARIAAAARDERCRPSGRLRSWLPLSIRRR